jgi:hypothetical protein
MAPTKYSTREVAALGAAAFREFGWVSRATAESTGAVATTARVWAALEGRGSLTVTPEDRDFADAALGWARGLSKPGWDSSMQRAASFATAFGGGVSVAAAIPAMYRRKLDRDAENAATAAASPSKWMGTVGGTLMLSATVTDSKPFSGMYGPRRCVTMRDAEGNEFTWWASEAKAPQVGSTFDGLVVVKKFGEFRGIKNTTVVPAPKGKSRARKARTSWEEAVRPVSPADADAAAEWAIDAAMAGGVA